MKRILLAATAFALCAPSLAAADNVIKPYFAVKGPKATIDAVSGAGFGGAAAPIFSSSLSGTSLISGFEGTSDYDTRALGIGLIPPDTMGAVGTTQYVELINGSFSVYSKATGTLAAPRVTDSAFWQAAGGTATGGDPRILFDRSTSRWLAIGFGANVANLQIAVSESSDALGPWHSASFTGYSGLGFGGTADFPTLAISGNSIIIGTNNFAPSTSGGGNFFRGTTLNVLNKKAIFEAGGPTGTFLQFNTPYTGAITDPDNGFAIQGVNRQGGSGPATIVASSLFFADNVTYSVVKAGSLDATTTASQYLFGTDFNSPGNARQPVIGANARTLTAGDERTGTNAWEIKGKIYFATTVSPIGSDHTVVRVTVVDKATNTILSETDIGGGPSDHFDYSYGSLAVNSSGQVVVGYNRSGDITTGIGGRVSIFARSFNTDASGALVSTSGEILIKQSLVDEYHNGSAIGQPAAGRQRWGDYSSVTVDPDDNHRFWVIGEFAREYNTLANHPEGSGTGFARWGTYIGQIGIANVPEPTTWALMIGGFGFVGTSMRRQRRTGFATA